MRGNEMEVYVKADGLAKSEVDGWYVEERERERKRNADKKEERKKGGGKKYLWFEKLTFSFKHNI